MLEYRRRCEALLETESPRRAPLLEVWIDHGSQPKEADYSYLVCMRPNPRKAAEWLATPPVTILANTPDLQAVRDSTHDLLHAFFHQPGELRDAAGSLLLACREPASVILGAQDVWVQDARAACVTNQDSMPNVIHLTIGTFGFNSTVTEAEAGRDTPVIRRVSRNYLLDHYRALRNREKALVSPTSIIKSEEWTYREAP